MKDYEKYEKYEKRPRSNRLVFLRFRSLVILSLIAASVLFFFHRGEEYLVVLPYSDTLISYPIQEDLMYSHRSPRPLHICDIGFGIFHAPFHVRRLSHLRQSWVQQLCGPSESQFYYYAHPQPSTNFFLVSSVDNTLTQERDMKCSEEYENLCCKTANLVAQFRAWLPDKKWYVKCDDDTYFVTDHLVAFLSTLNESLPILVGGETYTIMDPATGKAKVYGQKPIRGPMHGFNLSSNFLFARGGAGYAISKGLMDLLEKNVKMYADVCAQLVAEDMSMGIVVDKLGGLIVPHVGFNFKYPDQAFVSDKSYLEASPISWHMMKDGKTPHDTSVMGPLQYFYDSQQFASDRYTYTGYLLEEWALLQSKNDELNYSDLIGNKHEEMLLDYVGMAETLLIETYARLLQEVQRVFLIGLPNNIDSHSFVPGVLTFYGELKLLQRFRIQVEHNFFDEKESLETFLSLLESFQMNQTTAAIMVHSRGGDDPVVDTPNLVLKYLDLPYPLKFGDKTRLVFFPQSSPVNGLEPEISVAEFIQGALERYGKNITTLETMPTEASAGSPSSSSVEVARRQDLVVQGSRISPEVQLPSNISMVVEEKATFTHFQDLLDQTTVTSQQPLRLLPNPCFSLVNELRQLSQQRFRQIAKSGDGGGEWRKYDVLYLHSRYALDNPLSTFGIHEFRQNASSFNMADRIMSVCYEDLRGSQGFEIRQFNLDLLQADFEQVFITISKAKMMMTDIPEVHYLLTMMGKPHIVLALKNSVLDSYTETWSSGWDSVGKAETFEQAFKNILKIGKN